MPEMRTSWIDRHKANRNQPFTDTGILAQYKQFYYTHLVFRGVFCYYQNMFTQNELVKKIRDEFPKLKWKSAKRNLSGWDHHVMILDNKYVFRFPGDKEYLEILKTEIPLLNFLRTKVNIKVPKYEYIASDTSFAGYKLLPGKRFSESIFKKLTPSERTSVAKQVAKFLSALHSIPVCKLKKYKIYKSEPKNEYNELVKHYRKYAKGKLKQTDQQVIEKFLAELKSHLNFPHWTLTHGDIHHDNALINPVTKKLSAIIDFSDRSINDPALDFNQFWLYGEKFVHEIYKYYTGPKDKDFLQRSFIYFKRDAIQVLSEEVTPECRNPFKLGYELYTKTFKK